MSSTSKKKMWKIQFDDGILKTGMITRAKISATLCVCYFSKYSDVFTDSIEKSTFVSTLSRFLCLAFHISEGNGSVDIANHIDSCLAYVCTKTPIRVVKKKDYMITNAGNRIYIDMSEMGDSLRNVTISSSDSKIKCEYEVRHSNGKTELNGLTPDSRNFRLKLRNKRNKNGNKILLEVAIDDGIARGDVCFSADDALKVVLRFKDSKETDASEAIPATNSPETSMKNPSQRLQTTSESEDSIKFVRIINSTGSNSVSLNIKTQDYSVFLNSPCFEVTKEFKGWTRLMDRFLESETIFVRFKEDTLAISGNAGNEMFHKLYGPVDSPGCFQYFKESIKQGILSTRFTQIIDDNQIRSRKIPDGAFDPHSNPESFYLDKRMVDTLALAMFLSGSLKVDVKNRHCEIEAYRNCFLNMIYENPDRNDETNLAIYTENSYERTVHDMKELLGVSDDDIQDRKTVTLLTPKKGKKRICIVVWKLEPGMEKGFIDSMVHFAKSMKNSKGLLSKQWAHVAMDDVDNEFKDRLNTIENVHIVNTSDQAETVRLYGFPYSGGDRISAITRVKDLYDARNLMLEKTLCEDAICKLVDEELERNEEKEIDVPSTDVDEMTPETGDAYYSLVECSEAKRGPGGVANGGDDTYSLYGTHRMRSEPLRRLPRLTRYRFRISHESRPPTIDASLLTAGPYVEFADVFVLPPEAEKILQDLGMCVRR